MQACYAEARMALEKVGRKNTETFLETRVLFTKSLHPITRAALRSAKVGFSRIKRRSHT